MRQRGGQALAHLFQRPPHPGFYGAQGLLHALGDFGLRHAFEIRQLDGLALLRRKLIERAFHLPGQIEIQRLGRKVQWNTEREEVIGDAEASAMLARLYREPWNQLLEGFHL